MRAHAAPSGDRPALLPSQTRNSLVDIVGVELAAFEAEAQLRLTQLTTGQHSQARLVRIGHVINCFYMTQKRAGLSLRAMHDARHAPARDVRLRSVISCRRTA